MTKKEKNTFLIKMTVLSNQMLTVIFPLAQNMNINDNSTEALHLV